MNHEGAIIKAGTKLYLTVNPELFLNNKYIWVVDEIINIIQ